jgi:hypothetical protein
VPAWSGYADIAHIFNYSENGNGSYGFETSYMQAIIPGKIARFYVRSVLVEKYISSVTIAPVKENGAIVYSACILDLVDELPPLPFQLEVSKYLNGRGRCLVAKYPGSQEHDFLFADIGAVTNLKTTSIIGLDSYYGLVQPVSMYEIATFQGGDTYQPARPLVSLTSFQTLYAKNSSGQNVSPRIHSHNGLLIADMEFYGAVAIAYGTNASFMLYEAAGTGLWPAENEWGTVYISKDTSQASLKIPAQTISFQNQVELYTVTSDYLADASNPYNYATPGSSHSAWEMPTDWPANLVYPSGLGNAPSDDDASVMTFIHERGYILNNRMQVERNTRNNFTPYVGVFSYKPRYVFRKAQPPSEEDLLKIYNDTEWEKLKEQLSNFGSPYYLKIVDENGVPL